MTASSIYQTMWPHCWQPSMEVNLDLEVIIICTCTMYIHLKWWIYIKNFFFWKCYQKHTIWLLLCLNNSTSTCFMKLLKVLVHVIRMLYTVCQVIEVFGYSGSSVLSLSLGLASKMSMNVSMMLPIKWNEAVCTDKNCQKIQILTCINFQGPASIFPSKRYYVRWNSGCWIE